MDFQVISLLLFLSTIVTIGLGVLAWRYRTEPLARSFLGLMACTTIYVFGYGMEMSSNTLDGILLWSRVQYVGVPFISAFFVLVAAFFTGRIKWLKFPAYIFLFGIPTITMFLRFTIQYHDLLYIDPWLDTSGPFPILTFGRGAWYMLHAVYANFNILLGNIFFIIFLIRSAPFYRKQALLMIAGSLTPWLGYLLYISRLLPYNLDIIPFTSVVTGCIYSFGVFKYRILDISPIAREYVFESMRDGILVLDSENRLVDFNPTIAAIFPEVDSDALGKKVDDVLMGQTALLLLLQGTYGDDESVDIEVNRDGETAYYRANIDHLKMGKGNTGGTIISLYDETEHTGLLERLQELATTDMLTGVYNRRQFYELAAREVLASARYESPFSIILFDLDHFKRINDEYGHLTGDRALVHVTEISRKVIREIDIFGRYGGEEFIIALPQTGPQMAAEIAERIRVTLENSPFEEGSCSTTITASFGVSGNSAGDAVDLGKYIEAADAAMYMAKTAGRNRVICRVTESMLESP
jgi:diguanylate cyclase (GGDEF)-like protein